MQYCNITADCSLLYLFNKTCYAGIYIDYNLFEADFCLADDIPVIFSDLDGCLVIIDCLLIETETVAKVGLCLIGYLKAVDALLLESFAGKKVENVLDVLDAVDVAVDIDIAIVGVDGTDQLRVVEMKASVSLDGAHILLFWNNIIQDVTIVEGQQVTGLACLKVYHCPDAAGIAERRAVGAMDGEVAVCKVPHSALHPCPHLAMLELTRHLHHLDAKARKHPCVPGLVERTDAPTTPLRVIASGIEKMIAQHPQEDAPCEIHMERLHIERVAIYEFIVHSYESIVLCSSSRFAM